MANKRPPRKQWLFHPTSHDEQIVEEERERLTALNPGVKITRADVIRNFFARVKALEARKAELEAAQAKDDFEYRGKVPGREEDFQGAA